jgi:hypothetical protein
LNTIDKRCSRSSSTCHHGTKPEKPLTKEQSTAVDRVKEAFYEGSEYQKIT